MGDRRRRAVRYRMNSTDYVSSVTRNITLKWMQENLADGKSTLVRVIGWCHQVITGTSIDQSTYDATRTWWSKA